MGFSAVETIVAASVLLIVTLAVAGVLQSSQWLARSTSDQVHATLLLDETSEALQYLRDSSWSTHISPLTLNTPYYLVREASGYTLSSTAPSTPYYVTVTFESVARDGDGILDAAGTDDSGSRLATVAVYRSSDDLLITDGHVLVHDSHEN